ncbi:MAG: glycosyltransferase family 4 protein [Myxococcota bacterium]
MSRRPHRVLLIEVNEDGTVGGSHQCLADLVDRLDRTEWAPRVVFYQDNRFAKAMAERGVEVDAWDAQRAQERRRVVGVRGLRALETGVRLAGAIAARVRYLRRHRIELVHLNNSPCVGFDDWLPACRLLGIPIAAHARGPWFDPGPAWSRRATQRFDRVVAISDFVASTFVAAGVAPDRIRRVYDGIDLARWSDETSAEAAPATARVEAVMVGHLRSWKGQDVVLEALARLPPAIRKALHVRFVGEAPESDRAYADRVAALMQRHALADCAEFVGYVPDPRALLERADIVLHASTLPEPFGLVVVEGMALGKPVVASDRGGPAEIVTEGTGLLFDPREPAQLVGHLTRLVEEPALRQRLGRAARARARDFGVDRTVAEVAAVWRELLPSSR